MKILLTGGGTGGHFYPIIAVVQEINKIVRENHLADVEVFYMSPNPYNEGVLFDNKIIYKKNYAGKIRGYFSILNFFDLFKTGWGIVKSVWEIYLIYPDVVFGKGGYASFPALFAAKVLRIPVVIHESDTVPGKVNKWAGKFAKKIALSYPTAQEYFSRKENIAYTGQPMRKEILMPLKTNAHEFLNLDPKIKTVLVLGGSLGSRKINEAIIEALPTLVEKYQIVHQTGQNNFETVNATAEVVLTNSSHKDRYKTYSFMDTLTLRSAVGAADIIISRAGSTIFEIATWQVPSIIVPIGKSNGNHQVKNAFAYARSGAATVIEEENLTSNIIVAEIDRIVTNEEIKNKMVDSTKSFVKPEAAKVIAEELIKIGLKHEI
ncbi:MAG: undecaprenyldiphospho-muramoylpentapeptide beta-N-acetylglucosaminyltransferase [Candidatus Zambryskibacteria bacterium CG_4_9_14_3_um_filter_40_16]|uniref:UDP-N-acetylglucosamine--N-acetylmuramyl-(pentapeptide) pyrophosphoryl-undecaprenol N-acetylglucosamine transferase n=2 Tax=Candidatus Zambryskiibacteriota TaxID=1817925 RepID=A0A2H0K9H4_9BACT|nr:MAG: undecaprenyldiphospho-muramoylpentapeptide beta-N-acetylglucosaminyltransferase [Candidatus Zambryskibacteria bacterium CG11_big_fil_rev_8_21_14_0_20_40_24]PJA34592.1 MAG: undecaprenyldiphospho-muramoylpentapeptide beta-N-acetylglucosaminyltransferase [Candidatus Zambryskibacteria bacterium CG_4_9_14_3_um_filter_40_16]